MSQFVIRSALGFSGVMLALVAQGCSVTEGSGPGNGSEDSGAPLADSSAGPTADGSAPLADGGGTCGVAPTLSGAACVLPATITASMTLTSACQPWHIAAAGTVVADPSGPVLTIDPCVTVAVDTGGSLTVAGSNPGGLVAAGTASQPITFTSSGAAPAAGAWGNIAIGDKAIYPTTTLQFVDILYAGGSAATTGALAVSNSQALTIVLKNLTISHDASSGIHMAGAVHTTGVGFGTGSGNLTITDWGSGMSPIVLDVGDEAATVPATLTTGASGHDGHVELTAPAGSNIQVDATGTWASLPIPFLLDTSLDIAGSGATTATLTVSAPNVVQSKSNAVITVGTQGNLVANGTGGNLVFTTNAASPSPAAWGGILFNVPAAGLATSSLTGCTIDSAGSASSSSTCLDAAVVVLCTDGVTVTGPTVSGNIIRNYPTTESGLTTCVLSNAASYSNNTFSDLADGGIGLAADGGSSAICSY
jgi:hypothetical protein